MYCGPPGMWSKKGRHRYPYLPSDVMKGAVCAAVAEPSGLGLLSGAGWVDEGEIRPRVSVPSLAVAAVFPPADTLRRGPRTRDREHGGRRLPGAPQSAIWLSAQNAN